MQHSYLGTLSKEQQMKYNIIYKMEDLTTGKVYIGHTTKTLENRMKCHMSDFKGSEHNGKKCSSYEIVRGGNFIVSILEENVSIEKAELCKREQYWINVYRERCVNIQKPLTASEREQIISQWQPKQKYEKTGLSTKDGISTYMKEYREKNRENIEAFNHSYYLKNQERLNQKHKCADCGGSYCILSRATHNKTKKHILAVELASLKAGESTTPSFKSSP